MKKIASLFSIIALIASFNVKAQNNKAKSPSAKTNRTAEERTEMWMKKMTEKLAITEVQSPKLKDIVLKREKQIDANREKFNADKEAFRSAIKESNATFDAEVKKVLTVEQFQKLRELRREARSMAKVKRQKGTEKSAPADEPLEE